MPADAPFRVTRLLIVFATVAPPAFCLFSIDYYLRVLAATGLALGCGLVAAAAWPARWDEALSWAPLGGWAVGLVAWVAHLV